MAAYQKFGQEHAAAIRGGAVLHPTATATTVRVTGARGGDVVTGDGPYEAADLDEQGQPVGPPGCRTRCSGLRSGSRQC